MSMKLSTLKQHAEVYLHLSSTVRGKFMESLLSKISIKPSDTCLDVGCGTCNSTIKIAEKVGESGLVIGCDPDKQRIDYAKKNNFLQKTKFYEGTISEIELREDFFDIATSNLVYHWMNACEQQRTTKKVFSLLKSRGVFALSICRDQPQIVAKIAPYLSSENQQRLQDNSFFFTENHYKELFANAGFEILSFDLTTVEIPLDSLDSYLQLVDATYATNEFLIAYHRNKELIELRHFPDGMLCCSSDMFCVVLRKP